MRHNRIVTLHWYDEASQEGYFKNTAGDPLFANFEWEPESHAAATASAKGDKFAAQIIVDTTFKQIVRIERLPESFEASVTRKQVVRCDIDVLIEVYGDYNRKILAWTDGGLVEGVVTEASTQFAPLGKHKAVLVELERFSSGTVLVGRIVPEVDA